MQRAPLRTRAVVWLGVAVLALLAAGAAVALVGIARSRERAAGVLPAAAPTAVAAGAQATPPGGDAGGGAQPDLVLHAVTVRQDRLVVLVANDGAADFGGPIMVAVNDSAPRRVDVGKPLRPGEALEAVLNTEYVQRRAQVAVVVSTPPGVREARLDNNRLALVVGPDQPLDLELASAALDPRDAHLVITVRSRAPIPLAGVITIGVRESPPSNRLLAAADEALDIPAGGIQRFDFPTLLRVDLTQVTINIATAAIADADPANDFFPR